MDLNTFTEKAQRALIEAQALAEKQMHPQCEPEHLFLTLVEQRDGIAGALLRQAGVEPSEVAAGLRGELARFPQARGGATTGAVAPPARDCRRGAGRSEGHARRLHERRAPGAGDCV